MINKRLFEAIKLISRLKFYFGHTSYENEVALFIMSAHKIDFNMLVTHSI